MSKIKMFYHGLGLGANHNGIEFGYSNFISLYPKFTCNIKEICVKIVKEDFENDFKSRKYWNTVIFNCQDLAVQINESLPNHIPIMIGGDHSLALGSIKASLNHYPDLAVLWIDAHADFNTDQTTLSGHVHGMPLAALCNIGNEQLCNVFSKKSLKCENVALFATRDIDKAELELVKEHQIYNISMNMINNDGFLKSLNNALDYLSKRSNNLHISFDLDSINPQLIPGVTTPVKDGLTTSQVKEIFNACRKRFNVVSIDVVEYNPVNDFENKTAHFLSELLDFLNEIFNS